MRPRHIAPVVLVLAACGTDVSGPAASLFSCMMSDPALLEVGQVIQMKGIANRGLCLDGASGGAEFVYIPFHASTADPEDADAIRVDISGIGVAAASGPPSPSPAYGGAPVTLPPQSARLPALVQDDAFHRTLRARERGELGRLLRTGDAGSFAASKAAPDPQVGDLVSYNVAISCTATDYRTGRVEHVSEHAVVVADVENPAGLTAADYAHFGITFDTLVHPVSVAHFGEPTDIDGNGRSIIFFTRAVNELARPSEDVFTAGFFWSGDLFPEEETPRAEACRAANQAEMFYMLAADPLGLVGPRYEVDFIRRSSVGVIAHEYQHLINAARRLWVNEAREFEEPWLNEGLSHAAEELIFYAASGLPPGSNIGYEALANTPGAVEAFNRYMSGNFSNYARYLEKPDTASLMGIDILPTRGAAWSFLRYAADRSGRGDADFFMELVNARTAGLENLREVLPTHPLDWMQDWTVSVYADDAVEVDVRYRQASWNLRDLYARSTVGRFPLEVLPLEDGAARQLRLRQGGAAFPRFAVPAGELGVLYVEANGGAPPAALRGSLLRTR